MNRFKEVYESKENCKKKFEKILFGTFFKNKETDTKTEEQFFEELRTFLESNRISTKLKTAFDGLMDCKEYYKRILKPDDKIVYRGTVISNIQNKKIKWKTQRLFDTDLSGAMIYYPHRKIQSWTNDFEGALEFAIGSEMDGLGTVAVLEAKVDEDFIFNAAFLNKLTSFDESEIIRVSKEPIAVKVHK